MRILSNKLLLCFSLFVLHCSTLVDKTVSFPLSESSETTALLILDIQMDFFPGGKFELDGAVTAAEKGKEILMYFREKNLPIFHIQHVSTRKGATFFFSGTPGVEFHSSHLPLSGEPIIVKHTVNPFLRTNLFQELQTRHVKRLVVFGMMTHMVVDSTVRAAYDLGFTDIVVISDACATRELVFGADRIPAGQVHGSFLSALGYLFAKPMTASEFLAKRRRGE